MLRRACRIGGGAVLVGKHGRPLRDKRLNSCSRRHGAFAHGEKAFHRREHGRVFHQFPAQNFGNQIPSQVVGGRSQTARGDHQVGARERLTDSLSNFLAAIGNRDLPRDGESQVGQTPANPLLMRVQDPTEHQFGASVDKFDVHSEPSFAGDRGKLKVES